MVNVRDYLGQAFAISALLHESDWSYVSFLIRNTVDWWKASPGLRQFGSELPLKSTKPLMMTEGGDIRDRWIDFRFRNAPLRLFYGKGRKLQILRYVHDIFVFEIYRPTNVLGRAVVDVGANIGDTSIYFALSGASSVIALEPFPALAALARRNVQANNLSNVIILNEGIGGGRAQVDQDELVGRGINEGDHSGQSLVDLRSLDDIVERFSLSNAVLKVNCLGCESNMLQKASTSTIRRFTEIVLWSYGSKEVPRILASFGFRVSTISKRRYYVSRPVPGMRWLELVHALRIR